MLEPHHNPDYDAVRAQLRHPDELKSVVDKKLEKKFGLLAEERGGDAFKWWVTGLLTDAAQDVRTAFDALEHDQMSHVRVGDIKTLMNEIADRTEVPRVNFPPPQRLTGVGEMFGGKLSPEENDMLNFKLRGIQQKLVHALAELREAEHERHELLSTPDEQVHEVEDAYKQRHDARDEAEQQAAETPHHTQKVVVERVARSATSDLAYSADQDVRSITQNFQGSLGTSGVTSRAARAIEQAARLRLEGSPFTDTREYVRQFVQFYIANELPEWGTAVLGAVEKMRQLSSDKIALVERELRDGAIAMLMPGKAEQKLYLAKAIEKLKPVWIERGQRINVCKTACRWDYIRKLIEENSELLLADVPESPYISLTKPTQAPHPSTCDKTVNEQRALFADMKRIKPEISLMNIPTYSLLQAWFTARKFARNLDAQEIQPLDLYTCTRFIGMGSFNGHVPGGNFNNRDMVGFINYDARDSYLNCGFRIEVRVEL